MFGIVEVDGFLYTLGQSWKSLTFSKIYRHYIMERREYYYLPSSLKGSIQKFHLLLAR